MPKIRSHLSRSTANARRKASNRNLLSEGDLQSQRRQARLRMSNIRLAETSSDRQIRLQEMQLIAIRSRAAETAEIREIRLQDEQNRRVRNMQDRNKFSHKSAFRYDESFDYEDFHELHIGSMNKISSKCQAKKWPNETTAMCCLNGKVNLDDFIEPPEPLRSLLIGTHQHSKHFIENIRKYNGAFAMTSFGANEVREGNFMPTYKIHGQVYHRIGSLLPMPGKEVQFLQVYFFSEAEQMSLRQNALPQMKQDLIEALQSLLNSNNSYIRSFKTAMEQMPSNQENFRLLIQSEKQPVGEHPGRYNAPAADEVAVLMLNEDCGPRDVILHKRNETLSRISELHRAYDPLQYPLMFVRGEDGYTINIKHASPSNSNKTVSCMHYYAFRLMLKQHSLNHIHRFGKLFNQYCVDMAAKMITERLNYIRNHQQSLRADSYIHLRDALNADSNPSDLGQMVILPSTFTGSPRYLHERTQDALTYVRNFGRPDLFITFTCNPEWPEIKAELFSGQRSHCRHDIISRVFHLKLQNLISVITKKEIFGDTQCYMFTIEWQKRGLPHAHILVWLKEKIRPDDIDSVICAEIPDKVSDPLLYDIVCKNMMHAPCGHLNPASPCMQNGKCTKRYPRDLIQETQTGEDGYPKYRRRSPTDGGYTAVIERTGLTLDNKWVVPYSPMLLRCFSAHINVEYCHSVQAIKYICKYVNKGNDAATFSIENRRDEVQTFLNGRYISSSEAVWRIFGFSVHERYPAVIHLAVHLENGQRVYFTAANFHRVMQDIPETTLTAFFKLCSSDAFARTLLYCQVPSYYTWTLKKWNRRKRGQNVAGWVDVKRDSALGRVYTIHPNYSECFYLRLLLHHIKGPTSFNFLKTIDGVLHPTYRAACEALGLLESDEHWKNTLSDATISEGAYHLRELFSIMLVFCQMSNRLQLWNEFKNQFCEDFLHRLRREQNNQELSYNDPVYNEGLSSIQRTIYMLGEKRLRDFGLPDPQEDSTEVENVLYSREISYDQNNLLVFLSDQEPKLSQEQLKIYNKVLQSVRNNEGKICFIDAPGGTGKTFLTNLILAKVRHDQKIAIAVASSGIAATLLSGGRTAHSTFKLPLSVSPCETASCAIRKNGAIAQVLKEASLIVWDECTMTHKSHIDAVNNMMQDIRSSGCVMGGVTFIFSGDFRQTLPVVPKGTRADTVRVTIKKSNVWQYVEKLKLTRNMRVHLRGDRDAGKFAALLLKIGKGTIFLDNGLLHISDALGICVSTVNDLIEKVYPDMENLCQKSASWLCERAIVSTKNSDVDEINEAICNEINSEARLYRSIDTVLNEDDAVHYPSEFLNSLNPCGLPPHKLELKINMPIMLLRNLQPPRLCNGTRLQVKRLLPNIIEAVILTGPAAGETAFIPRIPMIPSDLPFQFKRVNFPVRVCFAMTINKAQGQSFNIIGVDLRNDVFSHGQLYVGLSRIGNAANQYVLTSDNKCVTKNIVYTEVFRF